MTAAVQAIAAALFALQTPPVQTGPLTIDQAAALAERNAFAVRLQASTVEKNRQRVAEARGNMGPKVGLTGVYTRYDEATTASFGAGTPPVVISPIDSKIATLSLTLPLDITGNLGRQVRAAEANYRASRQTLRASLNDARLNARSAFLAVLRAQATVGVQEQAVRDAQERLDQGRKLLAGEQVAKVDVDRLEAALDQAKYDLENARTLFEVSKNQFNNAIARPIETPVELVDITDLPAFSRDTEKLVKTGQDSRPEVSAFRETLTALSNITRATEATLNPTLNAGISIQRNIDAQGLNARDQQASGTLTLNIPIFDSGVTRARVRQARQDEETARINLEQVQLLISQDVRNAIQNLSGALARLQNAQRQVALAEEVFRLAQIRQQAAEGTYVEVVDAETTLTQARNGLVSARYDYLVAYAQLQRAVGSDNISDPGQGTGTPSPSGGGSR